jgi:lipoprotein-anchoring transpeptidase ErfK/SrfK
MGSARRMWLVRPCVTAVLAVVWSSSASAQVPACPRALVSRSVQGPTNTLSWRAQLDGRTAVFDSLPERNPHVSRWMTREDALSVLVLAAPRVSASGCWLRVRLPWRPNDAAGWVNSNAVQVQPTAWRVVVSRAHRTLTLFRTGRPIHTMSVVVGKPSTPTPTGLFAITWAEAWHPTDFLGSWVLLLTAHSDVLQEFDGGDGTVAIHGRGGSSLLDPLGSAASHGCVRLANDDIDWLVRAVGSGRLPGTPVQVS